MRPFKWFYAKLNLAVALVIHVVYKRWFHRRGIKEFLSDYASDRVFPIKSDERKRYAQFGHCIQCGLCAAVVEKMEPQFYSKFLTPALVASTFTRSLPDVSLNYDFPAKKISMKALEMVCPTGVPLEGILEFLKEHGH